MLLQDLLGKKQEFTERVKALVADLSENTDNFTVKEQEKRILDLQITQQNLIRIKEAIASLNAPLNGVIYSKAEAEQLRVSLTRLLDKHSKNKKLQKLFKDKQDAVKIEIAQYQKRINLYNASQPVTLELLLISK